MTPRPIEPKPTITIGPFQVACRVQLLMFILLVSSVAG